MELVLGFACTMALVGASALPPLNIAGPRLLTVAQPHGVLLTTFTDAGGFPTALNWAAHVRKAGLTPTIGVDGPQPRDLAAQWRATNSLAYALPVGATAARNGLERWTARWVGIAALLDAGVRQVVLSDTDVVWLRDPTAYFAAVARLHPHLDVIIGTDHATYAEAFRDDVPYSATASPTRRELLGAYQRVPSGNGSSIGSGGGSGGGSGSSSSSSSSGGGGGGGGITAADASHDPPDFDIDPHPVNGAKDGTWNPGVLLVRGSEGGRAFVAAEIDALGAAGRGLSSRGLSHVAMVSDQSEMCRMLRSLLAMDAAR